MPADSLMTRTARKVGWGLSSLRDWTDYRKQTRQFRAQTQGADRALDSLHTADHHHDSVRRECFDVRDHVETAHTGHRDVADHELKLASVKVRECFLCGGRPQTLVFFTEEIGKDFGYFDFVVNYQNPGRHRCRHGFLLR